MNEIIRKLQTEEFLHQQNYSDSYKQSGFTSLKTDQIFLHWLTVAESNYNCATLCPLKAEGNGINQSINAIITC